MAGGNGNGNGNGEEEPEEEVPEEEYDTLQTTVTVGQIYSFANSVIAGIEAGAPTSIEITEQYDSLEEFEQLINAAGYTSLEGYGLAVLAAAENYIENYEAYLEYLADYKSGDASGLPVAADPGGLDTLESSGYDFLGIYNPFGLYAIADFPATTESKITEFSVSEDFGLNSEQENSFDFVEGYSSYGNIFASVLKENYSNITGITIDVDVEGTEI